MARRRGKPLDKDGTDPCGGEPLDITVPDQPTPEKPRRRPAKAKDYGKCPECTHAKIAVLESGRHWVWKEHSFATWGRTRFTCRASGIAICELPEGQPSLHYSEPMKCPCERRVQ